MGGVLSVIFFAADSNVMDQDIDSVFFLSLEQKKPVFPLAPVLQDHFFNQSLIWSGFEANHPAEAKAAMDAIPQSMDSLHQVLAELQAVAVMQCLSHLYPTEWDAVSTRKVLPGSWSSRGVGLNPDPYDRTTFSPEQLDGAFKDNMFHASLLQIKHIAFPRRTRLTYVPFSKESKKCQILLSKWPDFDISITLCFTAYSAGLGKVAAYIGTAVPTNVWNVNWNDRDKFGMAEVDIDCHAKFFPLESGNPKVQRYRKWVQNLFDNLYTGFDWSVCDEGMRKYSAELAHLKTNSDLGRGFEQGE